jgi:hypothetical protein
MNSIDSEQTESITSEMIKVNTSVKVYSHNDKKQLVKRISDIKNKKCYLKIFKLIHGDIKYTKNDNGVFFNLTNLSDTILTNIDSVIQYYENKKQYNDSILKNLNNTSSNVNNTEDNVSSDVMTSNKKPDSNVSNI